MKKINWKVRFKNPYFWTSLISSIVTILYIVLDKLGIYPALTESDIVAGISAICSIFATIGVVADPTTEGITDSERALLYDEPTDSDNLTSEELLTKNNTGNGVLG